MDLLWELTDIEELNLPRDWDFYDEETQIIFLKKILMANISNDIFNDLIKEEHKKRVKRRQEKEARGEHTYVSGV